MNFDKSGTLFIDNVSEVLAFDTNGNYIGTIPNPEDSTFLGINDNKLYYYQPALTPDIVGLSSQLNLYLAKQPIIQKGGNLIVSNSGLHGIPKVEYEVFLNVAYGVADESGIYLVDKNFYKIDKVSKTLLVVEILKDAVAQIVVGGLSFDGRAASAIDYKKDVGYYINYIHRYLEVFDIKTHQYMLDIDVTKYTSRIHGLAVDPKGSVYILTKPLKDNTFSVVKVQFYSKVKLVPSTKTPYLLDLMYT
jgi:hypothetical protein